MEHLPKNVKTDKEINNDKILRVEEGETIFDNKNMS